MELVEGVASIDDVEGFLDRLDAIADDHGVTIQAFDAGMVVDERHLRRAVTLADRAIGRGEAIARDRGVEILLYTAGRRQIEDALAMGVDEGESPVVVVVAAEDADASDGSVAPSADERAAASDVEALLDRVEPTLGDYDEARVRAFFDVSDAELRAVEGTLADLVAERVALLTVER